ncbi:MAG: hypothetical protein BRC25_02295 [Parcubacteria group bacterium SW_6_46_9]|nr:MAG: hypothetical protein BRC25_02295 [Parcubacteria group bacterium SW_6_46_9]
MAVKKVETDYFYRVENEGVMRASIGMGQISPERISKATQAEVAEHFEETAEMFLADKAYDDQSYGLTLALFVLKILLSVGSSVIPYLLSILAKPLWFAGLAAAGLFVVTAFMQPAAGQSNLLKVNTSIQDGDRRVTPVLFRFWDDAYGVAATTGSALTIGGGPSWSVSDSLKSVSQTFQVSVYNALTVTHSGKRLESVKFWNVSRGALGRLSFYSKSFASFPTWQAKPSLILSANHITYGLTDKLSVGWRTKNVLVKTPAEWLNNWRMGPVAKLQLSENVSGLFHYAQIGNSPSVRIEFSVMF